MRKIFFRLKIITKWLRALERAARYKRQRDVLYNCWLEAWKNSNDLADVIKEMTQDEGYDVPIKVPWRENATPRK